jgi:hypothetical protein
LVNVDVMEMDGDGTARLSEDNIEIGIMGT